MIKYYKHMIGLKHTHMEQKLKVCESEMLNNKRFIL